MQPRAKSLEPRASFAVPYLLGGGSPKSSHVHDLASSRVLAKPGLVEALRMARDARMGKMGCNPAASFLQVDQTLLGCSSEQGDLSNCRIPTGAHSLAPNQPRRGPLTWNHFFDKLPRNATHLALLPHAMALGAPLRTYGALFGICTSHLGTCILIIGLDDHTILQQSLLKVLS